MIKIFAMLAIALVASAEPYKRSAYGRWIDADGDCQDTRQEVLIEESLVPVTLDSTGCRVVTGLWHCKYTGRTFDDPSRLDIDHFIPLAEVHRSGGDAWSAKHKRAYANDLSHPMTLIAVYLGANRSKGSRDPYRWMPGPEYYCDYATHWLALKRYWDLEMDSAERRALRLILLNCLSDEYDTNGGSNDGQ